MFKYPVKSWGVFLCLSILLSACTSTQSLPPTQTASNKPEANLPNPASAYCEEQGGRVEIREGEAGQYGVCIFPDGSGCDEWALFHGICRIAAKEELESITASYINANYGFSLDPSEAWTLEYRIDSLLLSRPGYCLFIGFKPIGQELPLFRTGMPAGDFEDGGQFQWLGSPVDKQLLVYESQTMLVSFCQPGQESCLTAGELDFVIWFEPCAETSDASPATSIPEEEIAEAQKVVESLRLIDK